LLRFNEQTIIQTITNNNQGVGVASGGQVTFQPPIADEERKIYKTTIERLEKEVDRMHVLIERLTERP